MATLFGQIVGGTLIVFLGSLFFEWLIFKRIFDSPSVGIPAATGTAALAMFVVYGFGHADGGPWNPWPGGIAYFIGGAVVTVLRLAQYNRRKEDRELEDVFD